MSDAINTHNQPRSTTVSNDAGAKAGTAANNKAGQAASQSQGNRSNPSTIVELSNSNLLQNIGDQIDKLPEVNEARVAAIKESLVQGKYQPDAEVIARKYSEIEKLLP
ncbi:MAG: flagellar biosynthesis anti-sigma factor FlgM [Gammaproteobacteria bacterium]|nr:flagellar biosynthesis anti-sigma factor FlgM [Gammaproteobacteria bacterium]